MPEANSLSKLKETARERVKANKSKREREREREREGGRGGGEAGFILLKVTVESQLDCLLFVRCGH